MISATLEQARAGSEDAFAQLVAPYRRELHLHCYRMLGSLVDAEDALQEVLLAAWRGLADFAGRSSVRAWLYRIATNRCLNVLRDAGRRVPTAPVPPFVPPSPSRHGDVTWLQPYPDAWVAQAAAQEPDPAARYLGRETVELAFVAALQELPPRQLATLLLRDVLDFSAAEAAALLGTSPVAVKGAQQRARASLARRRSSPPGPPGHAAAPAQEADLARRFARAFSDDDIDAVLALLTDDAWLTMPPAPHEYLGRAAVGAFLTCSADWRAGRRLRLVTTAANAQPAFGCYLDDPDGSRARFSGIIVLTVDEHLISGVTRFLDPDLAQPFALPTVLEP